MIRFYSPKGAKQSNLYANGFRVSGNTPHMVLKNTTSASIAVLPKFVPLAGASSPYILSQISLAPNQTAEVDLKPLLRAAERRHDLDVVSVEVTNWSGPGSVIGSIYGTNDATGVNYDIPLRDSGPVRSMTGTYPWKIADDFTTVVYITNISDQKAEFVGQINFDGGHFIIDPRELAPGETAVFDLAKIRDDQESDSSGTKFPRDASIGQFKWFIHGPTNGKLLLIGRAEMVSRSQHISSSYSCSDGCPPTIWGEIDAFSPPVVIVNGTTQASAWEMAYYSSGYIGGPYSVGAEWTTQDSTISIDPGGHTVTVTGEDPGVGCVDADMGNEEVYSWDGRDCIDDNFRYSIGDSGCTEVVVNIRRLQYIANGNHDIQGTLYVLKGTTVTFNALPDPPGATFPSAQPHWSGSSGITGDGQSKAVTFNSTSTSATDFKTVIASAGNTVTANVIVIELSGTLTPDDNFNGRSTTRFGIHERITLGATITPSAVTVSQVGGLQWVQTSGNGSLNASNDGAGTYDVSSSPESARLRLTILDGPSEDSGPFSDLTVVAPSDGYVRKQPTSGIRHFQNFWSCGFLGDLYILPDDVSFLNLFFKEEDIGASASGWLSFLNGNGHSPSGPQRIGSGTFGTGARVNADDHIFSGKESDADHGPYATGNASWAIPWDYSIDFVSWHRIRSASQTSTSTSTGRCTISKEGSGTFTKELSDPDSSW